MGKPQLTLKELSDYYYGNYTDKTEERVKEWFLLYGRTQDAEFLLHSLWLELAIGGSFKDRKDTEEAYGMFCSKLTGMEKRQKTVNLWSNSMVMRTMIGVAASLIVILTGFSVLQYVNHKEESNVAWIEKRVAFGETDSLVLSDGTSLWMNSGSSVIYPEKFFGKRRQIFFSGEGYFDVAKDNRSTFEIKAGESIVRVLGTEFNLRAYVEDDALELALLDGKVEFEPKNGDAKVMMSPGEIVEYYRDSHKLKQSTFDVVQYTSCREGSIYFRNMPLSTIAKQLERKFNVRITITNDTLKDISYHMAFVNNETLDEILSVLENDSRINIRKQGDFVEIY